MPNGMYYSSSSSSDEHEIDNSSEEQTLSLHSLASSHAALFQELESSSSTSDHSSTSTNDLEDEDEQTKLLPSNVTSSYPPIISENEVEDDKENISTLRLEEKIVSLMNRVWILETENDVLLSRWKKDGNDDATIQTMYQDPYEPPSLSSDGQFQNNNGTISNNENSGTVFMEDTASSHAHTPHNSDTTKSDDSLSLADQNQFLRKDLTISYNIGERMRIEMVQLGNREKLWAKKIEKTTIEKETTAKLHRKAMESMRRELEAERFKNQQLQIDFDQIKIEKQKLQIASAGKKCTGGSSATSETAQLISDLSNQLNLTMERESKLKGALREAKFLIAKQSKETLSSLDKHQREKDSLLKHNDELESLNIELVHKLDDLERQCNKLFTKLRRQEREKSSHSRTTSDDMVKMEDYLYTLAMKYEESQKEIASLKTSLDEKETKILQLTKTRAGSPSKTRSSLTAQDKEIIKVSSRIRKQNEHIVRMVYDKELKDEMKNNDRSGPRSNDFSFQDEQREEEDFEADSMFPNRVEI